MNFTDIRDWAELSYVKYRWRKPFERYKYEYEEDLSIDDFDEMEFLYEVIDEWATSME